MADNIVPSLDRSNSPKELKWIDVETLTPHPRNPRRGTPDKLGSIAESMKVEGFRVEKPLLIRPFEGAYQIIGGHTRHQAAILAGLETVFCVTEEMDDDTAILRMGEDNLNDPFSWFSQCIYVAENSVKSSKKGLSRTDLITAATGKVGDAAQAEGRRKGDVGGFLLWLEEQTVNVDGLLNPEVNLTNHLAHISKTPQQYWQQLTELLIEKEWSVKQTESIGSAIKDIDIPDRFHHWLNPESYIKKTITEALTGEIRTPRDLANWIGTATKQLDALPTQRKVITVSDDIESIDYWNMQQMFLDALPATAKGDKKPSSQKIEAIAMELLSKASQLDKICQEWARGKSGAAEREQQRLEELQQKLELSAKYAPVGFNLDLRAFVPTVTFDAIITDPPYLLSNGGTTVRSGKEVSVNKNFDDSTGGAIPPGEYCPLFYDWLNDGGYFVATCTHHLLYDLHSSAIAAGFELVQNLIWFKRNSPPLLTADRFKPDYEYISVFKRPGSGYFGYENIKLDDSQRGSTIDIPQCGGNERLGWHDTQKPLELMELLIEAYAPIDGIVLDPFSGSGTTAVAAKKLQRRCHWIEQKPDFFDKANTRIESQQFPWEA